MKYEIEDNDGDTIEVERSPFNSVHVRSVVGEESTLIVLNIKTVAALIKALEGAASELRSDDE